MRNYLCWDPNGVYDVINIDADAVPLSVFRAVDTETSVRLQIGETGVAADASTDEIISQFLNPARGHVQMAVLGPSGAGKSHLIRRLHQRIVDRPGIEVVIVERLQTNLRAILELLIQRLPKEDQARYRDELSQAGHALNSPEVQKGALLDGLAQAIQDDVVRSDSGVEPELEAELLRTLPDLFRDPYLRQQKLLKPGEIIPELVDRLFSGREGQRVEERLLFGRESLPMDGNLTQASAPARDAIDLYLFAQDETVPPVLAVINRNLDRAIARTLNFSGERLIDLMGAIREHLFRRGDDLVLLFEEFARLQGYDGAMLEALLKPGQSDGDHPSCKVRWAIACTSGRFKELPDTVRLRMDLVVDMEESPPPIELPSFAGRYLNAVRLGRTVLDSAYEADPEASLNACEECAWRTDCHRAFGRTEQGYGLYPFTVSALDVMANRKALDAKTGRLNPRLFQRHVLQTVLADEGRQIPNDAFPPKSLLDKLGGPDLAPDDRLTLTARAGSQFDRYLTLTQLWAGGRLANAPDGVAEAFGLNALSGLDAGVGPGPTGPTGPEKKREGEQATAVPTQSPDMRQLAAWVDGGSLDQTLANKLRIALYPLIERAIDWDMEKLAETTFAAPSEGRPFGRQSINFRNQATGGGRAGSVRFELPLRDDETTATAAALDALLRFEDRKDWQYAGGIKALAAVTELVADCAAEVLRQIRNNQTDGGEWRPVSGAIDLLLVGAALGGSFSSGPMTDEDLIAAVFAPIQEDSAGFDPKLRAVYDGLKKRRAELIRIVRAHASGAKGGRTGRFVDPLVILAPARRFRRGKWRLTAEPKPLPSPYRELDVWYARAKEDMRPALEVERAGRLTWLDEIETAFGGEENRANVLNAVKTALDGAAEIGLPGRRDALVAARDAFANVQFSAAVQTARTLKNADPLESELAAFGRGGRGSAIAASRTLIRAWQDFLAVAEAEVGVRKTEQGLDALEGELTRLDAALNLVDGELEDLEAVNAPA